MKSNRRFTRRVRWNKSWCCERSSNSAAGRTEQTTDCSEEKIPYLLAEVQSFGENRPPENEKRAEAAVAIRF